VGTKKIIPVCAGNRTSVVTPEASQFSDWDIPAPLAHSHYTSCPSHSPWFDHAIYICWRGQIVALPIAQSSPVPRHVLHRSTHSPQTLFSNTLNLGPSFRTRNEVWDTCKTTSKIIRLHVRFQVLTPASMKMMTFWDIASCSLVEVDRRFRGAHYLHHQGDDDGGSTHL
jgi:hypothetical protein